MDNAELAGVRQQRVSKGFQRLVGLLRPHLICDIGSCDGQDAMRFRSSSPGSYILAFEANPYNYEIAINRYDFAKAEVSFEFLAIAGHDGITKFHILSYDRHPNLYDWRMGASSILQRIGSETEPNLIACKKLDTILTERRMIDCGNALWIDVEGATDLILSGATRALRSSLFIKVELEKKRHWAGQVLDVDILPKLEVIGFEIADSSITDGIDQYDVLMIRKDIRELYKTLASTLD